MREPTYNFVHRLIGRITLTSQSNNDSFTYFGHFVELQSGTSGYVAVTIYKTNDRYKGEMTSFSFDYWTKELYFESSVCKALTEKIIRAFKYYYGRVCVSYDEMYYEDEDTTYEYDETDEDKEPIKHLNKN